MIHLAQRMACVHSDIRGPLYREALRMQQQGIPVMKLNTGNPAAFGFPLPESIRAALEGRAEEGVPYCDFQGMPAARQAIVNYALRKGIEDIEPEDVFIGNGVSEVVNFALMPLLDPGDEVLVPTPNYTLWSNTVRLCGYRCGWMVLSGPRQLREQYRDGIVQLTSMRLCANALAQLVIPAALEDMETPLAMVRPGGRLYEQRAATLEVLDTIPGLSYVKNRAAFYLFPRLDARRFAITDDRRFAQDLLHETHILVVPGSGFDCPDNHHFRLAMLPEAGELREAMGRMARFLETYRQN